MVIIIVIYGNVMKFYLGFVMTLLLGCQQTAAPLTAKNSSEQVIIKKVVCRQSTTPPLKNTQKLKERLIANGKIDGSLSNEEIQRQVNAYIRKKNAAFKNCQK